MHEALSDNEQDALLRPLFAWWLPEIRAVLGENLRSVLLGGSTVLGDFQPGWSDVDVCVVLHDPITEADGVRIGQVHDRMHARFIDGRQDGWCSGQAIEGSYVTAEMLADEVSAGTCYVAGGGTRWWGAREAVSPFDRLIFARHGRILDGEPVPVGLPSAASLRAQSHQDIQHFATPPAGCLHSAIWLAGIMHWLARTLVYWRDGERLSKTAALAREIAGGGPLAPHFVLPLALRREGSAATHAHLEVLRQSYLDAVAPARTELYAALEKYASIAQ